jgi:CRP-like cAMP-binding protein
MQEVIPAISPPAQSKILSALSRTVLKRVKADMISLALPARTILYDAGYPAQYCYFLHSGLCSLVGSTQNGNSVGLGIIGNEGLIGLPALVENGHTNYDVVVQISGFGFRIGANALRKEIRKCSEMHDLLLAYLHVMNVQACQFAICNRFHLLRERLCRWLLLASDRLGSVEIKTTQEALSQMLGSSRTALTLAVGELQKAGIVKTTQQNIRIVSRRAMRSLVCECYAVINQESEHFLAIL